jgi:hypothetical protein
VVCFRDAALESFPEEQEQGAETGPFYPPVHHPILFQVAVFRLPVRLF